MLFISFKGHDYNGQTVEGDEQISNVVKSYLLNLRELSLHPSPIDQKKAKKFMTYLEPSMSDEGEEEGTNNNLYEAVFTLYESHSIEFLYFGKFDEDGLFHGQAILKPTTYQSCFKGECKISKFGQIIGTFEHGILQVQWKLLNVIAIMLSFR